MSYSKYVEDDEIVPFSVDVIRQARDGHSFVCVHWGDKSSHLMVDAQTANMFITVYDALKPETQKKVRHVAAKGQVQFVRTIDKFWGIVS